MYEGQTVRNALLEKNPESDILLAASFKDFVVMPLIDANNVFLLLFLHKDTSRGLRHVVAEVTMRLANAFPPWLRYRTLMSGRLITLNKNPSVRPIGIGES